MAHLLVWTTLLLSLLAALGCQTSPPRSFDGFVRSTAPLSLKVPLTVERLAILHPKTYNRELMDAYVQLTGAAFQFKEYRPWLQIIERFDLPTIQSEQRFQLSGAVSDDTAVGVGRLLGVDSILLYRIDGPTVRDRVLAKLYGEIPPFTVTSKVIRVESAEVVYYNVVTAPVTLGDDAFPSFSQGSPRDFPLQPALERGIARTISDLRQAFGKVTH
jgi:hypothetical protein